MAAAVSRNGASVVQLAPGKDLQPLALQRVYRDGDELRVRLGEFAGRGIMVAGALVSERAVDDDEVRRRRQSFDLTSRGEAE